MAKNDNVQFESFESSVSRQDNLRQELERKIENLDVKVEEKASSETFYWLIGLLTAAFVTIFGGILTYAFYQIDQVNNKFEQLGQRTTILETIIHSKSNYR